MENPHEPGADKFESIDQSAQNKLLDEAFLGCTKEGTTCAYGERELPTGDRLTRKEGRDILSMPNGDQLTVGPKGDFRLQTNDKVRTSTRDGVTTIEYDNGDRISFDKQGIVSVTREDQTVTFARPNGASEKAHPRSKPLPPEFVPAHDLLKVFGR